MKLHHVLAHTLLPAIAASLAIWLAMEHQARLKLTTDHRTLEQQWQQMADLEARNEQLSNLLAQASAPKPLSQDQLMELLRLRGQVGVLRRQQPDGGQAREENRQIHAVLTRYRQTLAETNATATADYWPQGSWRNLGYGSPDAAMQTVLWAGNNGDVTNFAASMTDEAQTSLTNLYQGKSASEASVRLADETFGLQSVQILSRETVDDNTVVLTVELENQDGFQNVKMLMKKESGEWKFAGPQ